MGKKIGIITIIMVLLLSTSTIVFSQTKEITNVKISIGGKPLNIPSEYGYPFLDNQSRTMIPLRIVSESLGHKVEWNQAEQKATIDGSVHITIGEKFVETSSGNIEMDTWAILKGGRTYVPLRFVVEALGYEVSYDGPKASNGHHHMVDIYKEGHTPSDNVGIPTGDMFGGKADWTKDAFLQDYFKGYDEGNQYVLSSRGIVFDQSGAARSAHEAISFTNRIEDEGHIRLDIMFWSKEDQAVLNDMLVYIAGEEAGKKIGDWIVEAREIGPLKSEVDKWVKMSDKIEFYYDKTNRGSMGNMFYIRPIK